MCNASQVEKKKCKRDQTERICIVFLFICTMKRQWKNWRRRKNTRLIWLIKQIFFSLALHQSDSKWKQMNSAFKCVCRCDFSSRANRLLYLHVLCLWSSRSRGGRCIQSDRWNAFSFWPLWHFSCCCEPSHKYFLFEWLRIKYPSLFCHYVENVRRFLTPLTFSSSNSFYCCRCWCFFFCSRSLSLLFIVARFQMAHNFSVRSK